MRPSLIQCLQIAVLVFWTIAGLQVATQQAARLLAYDSQLGLPLFEAAGRPVYPFWRIITWRFAFGAYAPTTFAAVYPSILFGIAAGAGHAFVLFFVPDASVYRDPFRLALRPPPCIPWRPSPNARLARLIGLAEAEVRAAKHEAVVRALRMGEAEAAKRLAAAEKASRASGTKATVQSTAASPAAHIAARRSNDASPRQLSSVPSTDDPRLHSPQTDPAQLRLPFGGESIGTTSNQPAEQPNTPPPLITDRRHRMDFL